MLCALARQIQSRMIECKYHKKARKIICRTGMVLMNPMISHAYRIYHYKKIRLRRSRITHLKFNGAKNIHPVKVALPVIINIARPHVIHFHFKGALSAFIKIKAIFSFILLYTKSPAAVPHTFSSTSSISQTPICSNSCRSSIPVLVSKPYNNTCLPFADGYRHFNKKPKGMNKITLPKILPQYPM